ncbi:elongation factor P [Candidatus Kaiserbacteria bacterium]|nr:MAG: elongation factor P [Candidatus Kaiserbacteria bacterium]
MLSYTEVKPGKLIVLDGDPFEVLSTSGVVKKQRQKPHNSAKMRNLRSGSTVEKTFTQSDKIVEADISIREIKFLYENKGETMFSDPKDPANRFIIPQETLGNTLNYIRENDIIDAKVFEEEIIGIRIPIKVDLEVTEAPPNIRGNTTAGGNKVVVLETGLTVTTPLFINTGDIIRVNTETGEYVERA